MKQKNRVPLHVEPLEDRWVPATVRLLSGSLFISNPLIVNGQAGITLKGVAANNTFQVIDTEGGTGSAALGTYSVAGNIYITGTNAPDNITVNMNGWDYTGNLFVNSGNGNDTVNVGSNAPTNTSGTPPNTVTGIVGNINILTGYGNDSVAIGAAGSSSFFVGGNIQVTNTLGADTVTMGNATGADTFAGNVTLTTPGTVNIGNGKADSINGALTINGTLNGNGVNVTLGTATQGISVLGNFNMTAGSGNDTLAVKGATTFGGSVNVNLQATAGATGNLVDFSSGSGTVVAGNFNLQAGSASTTFKTASGAAAFTVQGNAGFTFGDNNNAFLGGAEDLTVQGNLNLTMGNGNDTVTLGTALSSVSGNAYVTLGNGTDATVAPLQVGGSFNYHSGNGNDSLNLGSGSLGEYGFVQFGNGNDSLTLATTGLVSGTYDGGGRLPGGANVFTQGSAVLTPNFTLSNFP